MLHKTSRNCLAAIAALALTASGFAQTDNSKAILDLLVKKGVLTQQDVADLEAQIAQTPAPAPAPAPAVTTTTSTVTSNFGSAAGPTTLPPAPSGTSPLAFRLGVVNFTPFGFLDFTGVYRNENTGSSIGTSFNSIPYANSSAGQLSETKFSAQNSRLGLKLESNVSDVKVLGYLESDFLGNAPTNLGVSSNSDTLRMRVYFADLRYGKWEFLAGQDWSMLTPNRKGISPLPSDIFYSNDMDTNYQAGLTWARQPQVRLVYHATDDFTLGLSIENPDQYVGTAVTLPSAFTATEVDTGAATTQPNIFPDVIGKAAYDTTAVNGLPWHAEVAGLVRSYKINTYSSTINTDSTAEGGGVSAGLDLELVKGLSFLGTGFYSYGGGRYINGLGPDFIVTAPDSSGAYGIGLVKAESAILGLEYQVAPVDTISAYYSDVQFGKRTSYLANGTPLGYGFTGSSNSNNKSIDEITLDNTFTFWKDPAYGALQLITQVSYVERKPWYVAPGALSHANTTMVFMDLRYVFP